MSKIVNRPSEAVHKPHEDVAAEVCTDASMLNDKELDAVAGGMDLKGASEAMNQHATYTKTLTFTLSTTQP